jgi:hypothetical protein
VSRSGLKRLPNALDGLLLLGGDLLPGEAQDAVTRCFEDGLLAGVEPSPPAGGVELAAVDLEDERRAGEGKSTSTQSGSPGNDVLASGR